MNFKSNRLIVQPKSGAINPLQRIEIQVRPVNKGEKWLEVIKVWCNNSFKEVIVNIMGNTSQSTPYSRSAGISMEQDSLEQGSMESEISEHTIVDSLSLTPLINASFLSTGPNFSNLANYRSTSAVSKMQDSIKSTGNDSSSMVNYF